MMTGKFIRGTDIPQQSLQDARNSIRTYSTCLLALRGDGSDNAVQLIGSGTLVRVGSIHGILTAHHVVDSAPFKGTGYIGFDVVSHSHEFKIAKSSLRVVSIAIPKDDPCGPDLAAIVIPQSIVGQFASRKSFWDISANAKDILLNPPPLDSALWFVSGCIGEWTEWATPRPGFRRVVKLKNLVAHSPAGRHWTSGIHDYLELGVDYDYEPSLPTTFGGLSGGGVWCVFALSLDEAMITLSHPFLIGVAYFETPVSRNQGALRCHGWQSVYGEVHNKLAALAADDE